MNNYFSKTFVRLLFTILLGVYFLAMQALEYDEAQFSIADGVYGRVFFMATGFHGIHVIIGTLFLMYVMFNLVSIKLT
jgi:heme/copper-type cytochrome/quinol oxidase subunit 3